MVQDSPRFYLDKYRVPFSAGECGQQDRPRLVQMYDLFSPKATAQGLPPAKPAERNRWIDGLLESSWNFLAWRNEQVVGHCSMLPNLAKKDAEYLVFVIPKHQNRGIGTALTRLALETARDREIRTVWLTVETINFSAVSLYKKTGFQFSRQDEGEAERLMFLHL